jgi:hypothetical protein
MQRSRLVVGVVEMAPLVGSVESDFCHGHSWVVHVCSWGVRQALGHGDHVFAFQTAAVNARRECAGSVPR